MNIYLASKSPRRQELLKQMQLSFDVIRIETPETLRPQETAKEYSQRVTKEKLEAAWTKITQEHHPLKPVLCADTEVVLDGQILGKPRDYQDAFDTLKRYSGRSHEVITSVGMIYFDYQKIVLHETIVTFAQISEQEIEYYLSMNDYQDKAGSYGIQSYIGQFITRIEGCFYSVMGLPLNIVRELLNEMQEKFKGQR